jgi:hypothetical protein
MRDDIREALESAASAGNDDVTGIFKHASVPSPRSVSRAQNVIRRFLENIEDESLTVLELRTEIEE